ncbi:heme utilization protein [Avibacterium sp. 20-15]|uniref:heme utilization protein n=1 Tax=unclassified Avibacterium TaxID=2685287 RepID=UPI00202756BD|nr:MULTISPECIES: heme utilization protein [unclassified Avibacterium]MCW9734194.1 heme utilization protein [Avibacterium sp. 20-15]URL03617.1 heme utilization protein [Avibacterium sp. 20-132]URL03829.1 heme utilization protein [Avibacterium sp. 20-132]
MKQGIYVNGKPVFTQIAHGNVKNMIASSQTISIENGQVSIQAPQLIIDGQVIVLEKAPVLHIEVFGNVNHIDAGNVTDIAVTGNVEHIETVNGDVSIHGDVSGSVKTVNGDVQAQRIQGAVNTVSGDIYRDD